MTKSDESGSGSLFAVAIAGYVSLGACVGVWSGSVRTLAVSADFLPVQLVAFFVIFRLSGIASMQIAGRFADRVSPVTVAHVGLAAVSLAWVVAGCFPLMASWVWAAWALAAMAGVALGLLDVGMNATSVSVAAVASRPVFGMLHGSFAVGALLGSGLLVATRAVFASPMMARALAFVVVSLVTLAVWWWCRSGPRPAALGQSADETSDASVSVRPQVLWVIVAMAVCVGMCEGAAFDWATFHVVQTGALPQRFDALGLTAVTATMVVNRFASDWLITLVGVRRVVLGCAVVAAAGYGLTMVPTPQVVLAGWLLVGLGAGALAPQVYGRAGQVAGGRGVAWGITGGYVGIVAGPALVGGLAELTSIQTAMVVPMVAAIILFALLWLTAPFATTESTDQPEPTAPPEATPRR